LKVEESGPRQIEKVKLIFSNPEVKNAQIYNPKTWGANLQEVLWIETLLKSGFEIAKAFFENKVFTV
jgi:hypothetical protein